MALPRESQGSVVDDYRASVMSVAAVTPALAHLLQLPRNDGVVISHRVWQTEFGGKDDVQGGAIQIDGVNALVVGVAPGWALIKKHIRT